MSDEFLFDSKTAAANDRLEVAEDARDAADRELLEAEQAVRFAVLAARKAQLTERRAIDEVNELSRQRGE